MYGLYIFVSMGKSYIKTIKHWDQFPNERQVCKLHTLELGLFVATAKIGKICLRSLPPVKIFFGLALRFLELLAKFFDCVIRVFFGDNRVVKILISLYVDIVVLFCHKFLLEGLVDAPEDNDSK